MRSKLPERKQNRLEGYDYSQSGMYFVTGCTHHRAEILGHIVGAVANRPQTIELSDTGQIVNREIEEMQKIRRNVSVNHSVIMPNHVHLILEISADIEGLTGGRLTTAPTVSEVVRLWKRAISKQVGMSIWQKSFHDHIIRDETEYLKIWQYIDENPARWAEDVYYDNEGNGV